MRNLPNTWSIFFPFPPGTLLEVDDHGGTVGHGTVRVNDAGVLVVTLRVPGAAHQELGIEAHYHQEGSGNLVAIRRESQSIEDPDAVIDSEEEHLRRTLRARDGGRFVEVVVRRHGDEVEFVLDGQDLTLRRLLSSRTPHRTDAQARQLGTAED